MPRCLLLWTLLPVKHDYFLPFRENRSRDVSKALPLLQCEVGKNLHNLGAFRESKNIGGSFVPTKRRQTDTRQTHLGAFSVPLPNLLRRKIN